MAERVSSNMAILKEAFGRQSIILTEPKEKINTMIEIKLPNSFPSICRPIHGRVKKYQVANPWSMKVDRFWVGERTAPRRLIDIIDRTTLGGAFRCLGLDHTFIITLVKRWRLETHTIHMTCGEVSMRGIFKGYTTDRESPSTTSDLGLVTFMLQEVDDMTTGCWRDHHHLQLNMLVEHNHRIIIPRSLYQSMVLVKLRGVLVNYPLVGPVKDMLLPLHIHDRRGYADTRYGGKRDGGSSGQ
ncbi:hypothetical protein M9H77_21575 [Catharanthus roseus]|uniref:Uncharacterized protein n=1 Tax=Catharanthus roseus TaxID=4058 RepID=A0ACC0AQI0_CATRO|nr:hypothetical protein M9H77_21575 [Catharanthus roseus]